MAIKRGLPLFRGSAPARTDLTPEQARAIAESLPPPVFDADRRLRWLDEEEGGEE